MPPIAGILGMDVAAVDIDPVPPLATAVPDGAFAYDVAGRKNQFRVRPAPDPSLKRIR